MENRLSRTRLAVEDEPVSGFGKPFRSRNLFCRFDELPRGFTPKLVDGGELYFWNDQDMGRCLRVDIPESKPVIPLIDPVGGNLLSYNPAEETLTHPLNLPPLFPGVQQHRMGPS